MADLRPGRVNLRHGRADYGSEMANLRLGRVNMKPRRA